MKPQNTPLQTLIIIGVILILCVLCDTQNVVNKDDVQPLSQHDSTILANYELKH